jgi:hypothetical protein
MFPLSTIKLVFGPPIFRLTRSPVQCAFRTFVNPLAFDALPTIRCSLSHSRAPGAGVVPGAIVSGEGVEIIALSLERYGRGHPGIAAGSHADRVCYTRSGAADGNVYYSFDVTIKSVVRLASSNALYVVEPIDVDTGPVLGKEYATANLGNEAAAHVKLDVSATDLVSSLLYDVDCDFIPAAPPFRQCR